MKITVSYYATLRQAVGDRQVEFALPPGSTLRRLVEVMVQCYPALKAEMLDPAGNLYGHIHIFVNGRDHTLLDSALDTRLDPGDSIAIFPPVGGG